MKLNFKWKNWIPRPGRFAERPVLKGVVWISLVAVAFVLDPLVGLVMEGRFEPFEMEHLIEGATFALAMIALIVGYEAYLRLRVRTRRALEESEERFRNLIEGSLQGIFIHKDYRYLFVNQALADILAYESVEELMAIGNMIQTVAPHEHPRMRGYYERRIRGEHPVSHYEFQAVRKDGSMVWLESQNRAVRWKGQTAIQGTVIDITERKNTEQALRESEARMRAILDNAAAIIFLKDREGRYFFINRHFAEQINVSNDDIQGKTDFDILPKEFAETIRKNDQEVLRKGIPLEFEEIAPHDGDRKTYLSLKFPLCDLSGAVYGVCGISTDITERKLAEEALREAKEKAEAATLLKDQFVSLVAHDLRSPFASIMGLLRMLEEDPEHPLDAHQRELFTRMLDRGESLVRMIDELLNISRLQTGKITPAPTFMDVRMVTGMARGCSIHLAEEKEITLENEVPAGTPVYADLDLLLEVFQNLLSNAIKFCSKGDKIRMFLAGGDSTTIAVQDTGQGINEAILPDLFRHEIKTTSPGTAGEMGTGLGLPFCHDIMVALGGSLRVESSEGKGSIFYVQLPATRPRVLLVGNGEVTTSEIRTHLQSMEVEVSEAENLELAVRSLEAARPQLIIADLMTPAMDGLELLNYVKNDPKTRSIPVIIMTSDSDTAARDRAFRMGADDFVKKPVVPDEFFPRVRRFLQ